MGFASATACAGLGGHARAQPSVGSCRMANLTLRLLAISNPTGWGRTGLQLTNSGTIVCSLAGFPTIALHDRQGSIPFSYRHVGNPRLVVLEPAASAFVMIGKFRCDLGSRRVAASGQVSLQTDANVRTHFALPGPSLCKGGGDRTVIVTPFEPTLRAAYLSFFARRYRRP